MGFPKVIIPNIHIEKPQIFPSARLGIVQPVNNTVSAIYKVKNKYGQPLTLSTKPHPIVNL